MFMYSIFEDYLFIDATFVILYNQGSDDSKDDNIFEDLFKFNKKDK